MYVQVQELTKNYDDFSLALDFSILKGEIVSILGPSGSGKSTLLRILAGLIRQDSGRIMLNGVDISNRPPQKRGIGMVFQDFALFGHQTVSANIGYGLRIRGKSALEQQARVSELLEAFSLTGQGKRSTVHLSGGEKQRVALARSLAVQPELMLFDEPLGSLDAGLRKSLRQELKHLQRELGYTSITVTHDQDDALSVSDRIMVMKDGRILQNGSPEEVWNNPADIFVAHFVGDGTSLPLLGLSHDNGQLCARTPLGLFTLGPDVRIPPEPRHLFFRTEHVRLQRQGAANTFAAVLADSEFFGRNYRLTFQAASLAIHALSDRKFQRGSTLSLSIDAEHLRLL